MSQATEKYLGAGGLLARALPGFAPRTQQLAAAAAVETAMAARSGVALIEAGTGVGKTLAYLIPALRRATPERKVVISTHTLALQGQLAEKDVPLTQSLWTKAFAAATIKGRGNYLCLQDFDAATGDLWTIGDTQFAQIGRWSRATGTGDVAELDFTYPAGWTSEPTPTPARARSADSSTAAFTTECAGKRKKRASCWSTTPCSSRTW